MLRSAKNLQRNSCKYYRVKSTHPLRSATDVLGNIHGIFKVSIHAPLVEYDICFPEFLHSFPGFYPRTPRGVRPDEFELPVYTAKFQSTHPSRSATDGV